MNLVGVLVESIKLLKKNPKVFIPRLITTTLYTVYTILAARLTSIAYPILKYRIIPPASSVQSIRIQLLLILLFPPIMYVIDLISYAMYPSIVRDYHSGKPVRLLHALWGALRAWNVLLVLGLMTTILLLPVAALILFGLISIETNIVFAVISLTLTLVATMAFIILVFFVVPTAVIDKKGIIDSFKKSFSLAFKHKYDLLKVNIIFLILVLMTIYVAMASEFVGLIGLSALIALIIIKLIQAVVYTYINVVNPYLYVRLKE